MVTPTALTPKAKRWMVALGRAATDRIVVYRLTPTTLGVAAIVDGAWTPRPYTIVITGERPSDVMCSCIAGQRGLTCKHLAAAVFARKYGVYARRPILSSTPAEIAHTERLKGEVLGSLIAGVAPALADLYA